MNNYSVIYLYGRDGLWGVVQYGDKDSLGRLIGEYPTEDIAAEAAVFHAKQEPKLGNKSEKAHP